ncbi:MAG: S41 family peptidase [Ktedonobacteraceae bacterium]
MSRYDDPRWYEEQNTVPPKQPTYNGNGFNPYTFDKNLTEDDDVYPHRQHQQPPSSTPRKRSGQFVGQFLAIAVLVVIAFFGGWFSHQFFGNTFDQSDQSRSYSQLIQQAWSTIDQHYVDRKAVDYKKMAYGAISSMVDSLHDRGHTRFLTPQQVQAENQQLSGTYKGFGLYLSYDTQRKLVIISSTIPHSPAEKAGFKRGDAIIAVDGQNVKGKDIPTVSALLGSKPTSTAITVQRPNVEQPLTIKVARAEIEVQNVIMHYIPEDHIAHIQIVQFANGVSDQLRTVLTQAQKLGAKKIILDLRDDPGGYLQDAINTASDFVPKGNVLLEQDSTGQKTAVPVTGNTINTTDTIVILTNKNTASAAEIVSGALHDNGRATIIGVTTFGTGTVLEQYSLTDGSAILLGTQEWLTPKGKFIRDNGITPDIKVELGQNGIPLTPADENAGNMTAQQIVNNGDAQLNAAIDYLKTH